MIRKPLVAVLILNYNSASFLKPIVYSSIESALRINYPNLDVVLVDNCSTDGSFYAINERFGKDILALRLNRNYGYAGGNEYGFRSYVSRRGVPDYVLFMNNDYVVKNEDFLKELVDFLESREKTLLAKGCSLQEDGRRLANAGSFIDSFGNLVDRYHGYKISELPEDFSYITYASGECFIAKVKPILEVRGLFFQPRVFSYWDETELALSLWTYGFRSVALPIEAGIHYSSRTFAKFQNLALYLSTRNRYAVMRSYFRGSLKIPSTFGTLGFLAKIPVRPFQASKGRILIKAFLDSYRISFSSLGSFYPAVIFLKGIGLSFKHALPLPRRAYKRIREKIRLMTIGDQELKSSPLPFMIPINV